MYQFEFKYSTIPFLKAVNFFSKAGFLKSTSYFEGFIHLAILVCELWMTKDDATAIGWKKNQL
jgi:hypothetical protein